MSRFTRTSTPARRDAGLRRLRTLNRVLIGAAVAGTGLITDVAAHAFPGHKRSVTATAASPSAHVARRTAGENRRHHRRHARHHAPGALRPPAHAPTTTHSAAPTPAPTTSAPQPAPTPSAPQPAPQPAPAPVVSGGS